MSRPLKKDWDAAIRVLRYLSGHQNTGLVYSKQQATMKFNPDMFNDVDISHPCGTVDSDFANDPDTSRSVGGMIVTLHGTAVSWRSKLQSLVDTSIYHSEYIAAFECAREIVWLRMLLQDIGMMLNSPSVVLEDNAAVKWMSDTVGISDANKHIRVTYHWVRQCIQDGYLLIETLASKDKPSAALTKAPTKKNLEVMMSGSAMKKIGSGDQSDLGCCLEIERDATGECDDVFT